MGVTIGRGLAGGDDLGEVRDGAEAADDGGEQGQSLGADHGIGVHNHDLIEEDVNLGTDGGVPAIGGFLTGNIVSGLLLALFMSNSGGLWDNAKKYVESGHEGGKGSETHKAAVVGDTVGDPFKDTAGPSINTQITVVSLVSSIMATIFQTYHLFG